MNYNMVTLHCVLATLKMYVTKVRVKIVLEMKLAIIIHSE